MHCSGLQRSDALKRRDIYDVTGDESDDGETKSPSNHEDTTTLRQGDKPPFARRELAQPLLRSVDAEKHHASFRDEADDERHQRG